jgi:hypothetical protein
VIYSRTFIIIEPQEIVIIICIEIMVLKFDSILRINIHFEVRRRVHRKLVIFNLNNMSILHIVNINKWKSEFLLTLKLSWEQSSFILECDHGHGHFLGKKLDYLHFNDFLNTNVNCT